MLKKLQRFTMINTRKTRWTIVLWLTVILRFVHWLYVHLIWLLLSKSCGYAECMCVLSHYTAHLEVERSVYGLSGASGRHPCLWCLIKSSEMKIPLSSRGRSITWTVEGILDDHDRFVNAGGDPKKVKEYNNCLSRPFFSIPLSQVQLHTLQNHTHHWKYSQH